MTPPLLSIITLECFTVKLIFQVKSQLRLVGSHNTESVTMDHLRHSIKCRVNHEATKRRLLTEINLTYDTAIDLATIIVAADRNVKNLTSQDANQLRGVRESSKEIYLLLV